VSAYWKTSSELRAIFVQYDAILIHSIFSYKNKLSIIIMISDEFRLYNSFKPIKVEDRNYILFFNGNEQTMERKLMGYTSFIPWMINKQDFNMFVKSNRVHFIEKIE
jgi:hypothetical protein